MLFVDVQEKSDSSEAGKESSPETGPEGQDASSSEAGADDATSSGTKEGYEEKMVQYHALPLFTPCNYQVYLIFM